MQIATGWRKSAKKTTFVISISSFSGLVSAEFGYLVRPILGFHCGFIRRKVTRESWFQALPEARTKSYS